MEYKSKSSSVALAAAALIIFLILVSSAASAAPLTITETRITTSGNSTNADIYGNTIVWQDARNGGNDVYIYDSSTKKETRITKSGSAVNPAIYGNLIVWSDGRNKNEGDIYMYDLSAKKETRITKSGNAFSPDIYGNKIVWYGGGIFLYDLSTKRVTKIAEDDIPVNDGSDYPSEYSLINTNPAIYGNRIVWLIAGSYSAAEPFARIGIFDLSTKKVTEMGGNGYGENYVDVKSPDIYNNRVVWHKWIPEYGAPAYVCMYDFSTKSETLIPSSATDPHIYGDRIVWTEYGQYGWQYPDIYVYDLTTKNKTRITTNGSASNPRIYGDRIVWQDSRSGRSIDEYGNPNGWDIYMGTLTPPFAAGFSASPTSGKVPLTVKFTDKSTGSPTSWYWNFGDKYTSKVKNPVHKYTKAGKYSVSLTVTNAAGSNTVTKSSYITVLNPPVAAFSAYPMTGKIVKFTDKSTNNPTSWYWNFGDKTTSKLQNPPVHKYPQAGKKYTVSLTVKNAAGTSTAKKTITTLR
ncbi:MAG: PKD domain-containing protein [Methanosarcina sp.]|nr:hypothetical protein BGV40_07285 [Methanosarcina sp. Ant1]